MSERTAPIIVVGAGMAGLSCALKLIEGGREVLIYEAADEVGGRIRTDEIDGYLIDRGFQVYLDAYPNAGALLDLDALDLRRFDAGALIWRGGKFHQLMDVFRHPGAFFKTVFAPVGTWGDKLKVGALRAKLKSKSLNEIAEGEDISTEQYLLNFGFSHEMIEAFFRGFYGGIFLERELRTSSRMFEFTFKMFTEGHATVPARGMQQIPLQLASRLPSGCLHLSEAVAELSSNSVTLANGELVMASQVVVATDAKVAGELVPAVSRKMPAWRSEVNFAFGVRGSVLNRPIIALNGLDHGAVNNVCNMAALSPHYAPEGHSLMMVTALSDSDSPLLEEQVRSRLCQWFDTDATKWRLLKRDRILRALPEQLPLNSKGGYLQSDCGIWLAGDYCESASIEGAVVSGQMVAARLLKMDGLSESNS